MSPSTPFALTGPLPTGRVAIEASAGTGKTYTLTGLAARYVGELGVPVSELLIVTFTRAAAAELRDRVRARLASAAAALRVEGEPPPGDPLLAHLASADRALRLRRFEQAVTDFDAATVTTIHGFAQQVRATLGSAAPGDLEAALVNDRQSLTRQVVADVLAAAAVEEPDRVAQLPSPGPLAEVLGKVLGNPGSTLVPGPDPDGSSEVAARWRRLVDRSVELVHERRRATATLSFDDLLTELCGALRSGEAAVSLLARRFRVGLVDEFQDTDPVQWEIFSRLFPVASPGRTLVLVGDAKQAIYGFRGAVVQTYIDAVGAPGTTRSTLATNWRSDGALLVALERLLGGATFGHPSIEFVPVGPAPDHAPRRLTLADGTPMEPLHVRAAVGADIARTAKTNRPATEAVLAAVGRDMAVYVQTLLEQAWLPGDGRDGTRRPVRPRDIAVLVGTHADAAQHQRWLRHQGIPAVVTQSGNVTTSAAAGQWRWLLSALAQPANAPRARTAALSWFFGWSAAAVDAADDDALAEVQEQLKSWTETLERHGVAAFCARLWADTEVLARVLSGPDGDRHATDLEHLAGLLQCSAPGRQSTAGTLLDALAELSDNEPIDPDEDLTARRIESEDEVVQIMTIHTAKGLEFPIVCAPTLWHQRNGAAKKDMYWDADRRIRTIDVAVDDAWPDPKEARRRRSLAEYELRGEDLRLLYVALTRAQHQVAVWWSSAAQSEQTALARVLFGRDGDAVDRARTDRLDQKVTLPEDSETVARLEAALSGPGSGIVVAEVGALPAPTAPWEGTAAPDEQPDLALATLGRPLERLHRRWSFTAMTAQADAAADPEDESGGDAGVADEPPDGADHEADGTDTDLPLGAVPGGAEFGTLVHAVLERVDFAAPDLDDELGRAVDDLLRFSRWPVERAVLHAGLRAAIESPLGPLFGGGRLRDLPRGRRLDELAFELRLATTGAVPSERDIGRLVLRHLGPGDPLHPWAEELATGAPRVRLAGHLTGSIDAVFQLVDPTDGARRYVLADYKTNTLGPRSRRPRAEDYRPDRLPAAMAAHHYPLQALLYAVALHRYLRWREPGYDPAVQLGGAAYLFVRGMAGPATPVVGDAPHGVFSWHVPPALVVELSELLDGAAGPR